MLPTPSCILNARGEQPRGRELGDLLADVPGGRLRTLVEAFGPRRIFWGTDLTHMPCTYYECLTLFTEHLPWLQGEELEWVMGRGIYEWLGWPL